MTARTLKRHGYTLKHSAVGWWVDGACGYLVAGYFKDRDTAIEEAGKKIADAKKTGAHPIWRTSY